MDEESVVVSNENANNIISVIYEPVPPLPNIEFRWLIKDNGSITDRELQYRFATKVTFECNSNEMTEVEWSEWKTVPTIKGD